MAKKEETTLGVAVVSTPVNDALAKLNERLKALKHIQDSVYRTGTSGKIDGFSNSVQTETDIATLVKMFGSVTGREVVYNQAQSELEITDVPIFKLNGFTKDDWKADIQLRVAIIQNQEKLNEYTAIKKELTDMMGKEEKLALLLERLEKV